MKTKKKLKKKRKGALEKEEDLKKRE